MVKYSIKFLAGVAVAAIAATSAQATVYTVNLTGLVSNFSASNFDFGGNHYDRFILSPLSGLDPSNAFTVSQGDTIDATVTLDTAYSIPTSISYTNILQIFTGSSFPAENTAVSGTFTFYDLGSPVATFSYGSTTSGQLASYAANFPPTNAGFTFDSFTNDTLITSLPTPATVDGSYFFYDLVSPATPAPEPITLSLFGAGLLGTAALRRRKKKTV